MWFVGLIVGAMIGAMGDFFGALAGAVVGAIAAHAFAKAQRAAGERMTQLERAFDLLQDRLSAIEQRVTAGATFRAAPEATAVEVERPPAAQPATEVAAPVLAEPSGTPQPARAGFEPNAEAGLASEPIAAASVAIEEPASADPSAAGATAAFGAAPDSAAAGDSLAAPQPSLAARLWNWIVTGNPFVRIGIVVLFFGVAFLLRYAAERMHFPIELRLAAVAVGAIALLAIGWWLRMRRPTYALVLQGGGVGVLFLTVFAAYRLYGLLPSGLAFVLLIAFAALGALLAVLQDSRALAVAAVSGGFLAPVLASTGTGSHVALFGYYVVLNAGILAIAWFKAWRILNVVGFAFTFVIGALWGANFYRPELFASTEPFLITFFLFYVAIAVLFARRQAPRMRSYVDGTIVFGTPLVAFVLQSRLVDDTELGAAWSALAASAFYLAVAAGLYRSGRETYRLLIEAFIALGVVFATLAVPLAFDARVTAATWALEGAGIVWVSTRQRRALGQALGAALQLAAGAAFAVAEPRVATVPIANSACLGALMLAAAGVFSARQLNVLPRGKRDWRGVASWLLLLWGVGFWLGGAWTEIERFVLDRFHAHVLLGVVILTCCAASLLGRRLDWQQARILAWAWLPALVLFALADVAERSHPFESLGYLVWPLAAAAHLWLLARHEEDSTRADMPGRMPARSYHAIGLWLFCALAAWQLGWAIDRWARGGAVWGAIGWAAVPATVLWALALPGAHARWPLAKQKAAYLRLGAMPIALFVLGWTFAVNVFSSGDPRPLPYLPLLNPLDLAQAGAFLALAAWWSALVRYGLDPEAARASNFAPAIAGIAIFVWLNGVLLRTLHHWAGVRFDFDAMMDSMLVQAAVSIFWTLIGLVAMVFATRRGRRVLWMAGAALLGCVTLKLFFVDLSAIGGLERIVSFLAVGVLLLVVGYFSPVPPKQATQ